MTDTPSSALSASDRALLLAFRGSNFPEHRLPWKRLAPKWARQLQMAWSREFASMDPADAWSTLKTLHIAEASFDASHVHESWIVRALQGESPSVIRALVCHFPESIRLRLGNAFAFDQASLTPDGPIQPSILAWSQSFWGERLVGGPPLTSKDAPVIAAIVGLSSKEFAYLVRTIGLAKLALTEEPSGRFSVRQRRLLDAIQGSVVEMQNWAAVACRDREMTLREGRPSVRNLGLLSVSRLLASVELIRVRWAIQHLPYPMAKRVRAAPAEIAENPLEFADFESVMLTTAWQLLEGSGKIRRPWGGEP